MIKKLILLRTILKDSNDKFLLETLIKEADDLGTYESDFISGGINPNLANSLSPLIIEVLSQILQKYIKMPEDLAKEFSAKEVSKITEHKFLERDGTEHRFLDSYIMMSNLSDKAIAPGIDVDSPPARSEELGPLRLAPKSYEETEEEVELIKTPLDKAEKSIEILVKKYIKETDVFERAEQAYRISKKPKSYRDFLEYMNRKE